MARGYQTLDAQREVLEESFGINWRSRHSGLLLADRSLLDVLLDQRAACLGHPRVSLEVQRD